MAGLPGRLLAAFWVAWLLSLSQLSHAVPVDISTFKEWPVDITHSVSLYEDPSGTLELDDIVAVGDGADGFQPASHDKLHPGPSRSAWWLQVSLVNHDDEAHSLYLVPSLYVHDHVDFYLRQEGQWERRQTGLRVPHSQQVNPTRHSLLPIALSPGETVRVLIRAQSEYPLQLRPYLYSEEAYLRYDASVTHWDGLLYGGLLALGWASLVIALLSRNVAFFLLSAVSLIIALLEIDRRGYGKFLLWPESIEWSYRSLSVLGQLSLLLFLAFALEVARQERIHLPLRRWLIALMTVHGASALTALFGSVHLVASIVQYTLPAHTALVLITAIGLAKSNAPTRKLILLIGVHGVFRLALSLLESQGMLPEFLLSLGPLRVNPMLALVHFYINLAALAAWINHVGKQRREANRTLLEWQQSENQRLSEEVARQTKALSQAVQYANEKNRQKTELLAYISHDLRAPLATIVGYAQLLHEGARHNQNPHIDAIVRSTNYQMMLIDELLHYSRAELKPLALTAVPTNTATLLDDIAQQAISLCRQQNNRFECRAASPLPETTLLDGKRLQQVLLNLLSNATKFTRHGVISLHINAEDEEAGNAWRLRCAVSDTGMGIDAEQQATIFKAFEQAKFRPDGVGLGLFIAQNIVEEMGGKLQLQSELDKGSTFSFEIRVSSPDHQTIAWSPPAYDFVNPAATDTPEPTRPDPVQSGRLPASDCMELAMLARDGNLTEIESWLARMSSSYPHCMALLQKISMALQTLDLQRIENLATGHLDAVREYPAAASNTDWR